MGAVAWGLWPSPRFPSLLIEPVSYVLSSGARFVGIVRAERIAKTIEALPPGILQRGFIGWSTAPSATRRATDFNNSVNGV